MNAGARFAGHDRDRCCRRDARCVVVVLLHPWRRRPRMEPNPVRPGGDVDRVVPVAVGQRAWAETACDRARRDGYAGDAGTTSSDAAGDGRRAVRIGCEPCVRRRGLPVDEQDVGSKGGRTDVVPPLGGEELGRVVELERVRPRLQAGEGVVAGRVRVRLFELGTEERHLDPGDRLVRLITADSARHRRRRWRVRSEDSV